MSSNSRKWRKPLWLLSFYCISWFLSQSSLKCFSFAIFILLNDKPESCDSYFKFLAGGIPEAIQGV